MRTKTETFGGLEMYFFVQTVLLYFLRFNFLNALQSDNDSKTVYVLRHKFALGLSMSHIYATDIKFYRIIFCLRQKLFLLKVTASALRSKEN